MLLLAWLQSARIAFTNDSLHSLVLASKIPSIAKARSTYGHFWTASQMHKVSGTYWKPDQELAAYLQQDPICLNPSPKQDSLARLASLRKDMVGGLLLVTQQFSADGVLSQPYITIVAAPLLATLGHFDITDPPGITYSDFWEESVLATYGIPIPTQLHCPLVAATEGFSEAVTLPSIIDLLTKTQPLFFSWGEQLVDKVILLGGSVYRAFFLPEVCGLPLGMTWPTPTSFTDLYASIHSLRSAYSHFLQVLTAIQPGLTCWLEAIKLDPARFTTPSISFLEVHDLGFPDIATGVAPKALVDCRAFSPLLEMAHGFLWHLTCNSILATGTSEAQKHLQTFLSQGETAITASSYFRDQIPGRLCPNFAYHFNVVAHWPTRISPLEGLTKLPLVSARAQEYAPMTIGLHIAQHPSLTLITRDQQMSKNHRRSTSRYSYPDPVSPHRVTDPARVTKPAAPQAPLLEVKLPLPQRIDYPPVFGQSTRPGPPQPGLPTAALQGNPYPVFGQLPPTGHHHQQLPPPPAPPGQQYPVFMQPRGGAPVQHPVAPTGAQYPTFGQPQGGAPQLPTPHQLYSPPTRTPGGSLAQAPHQQRSLSAAFAILTMQGCTEASTNFLNCCRLLVHHDPTVLLMDLDTGQPLSMEAVPIRIYSQFLQLHGSPLVSSRCDN
jgi:hypothetical protein